MFLEFINFFLIFEKMGSFKKFYRSPKNQGVYGNIIDNKDKVIPRLKRTKLNNLFEMICNSSKSIPEDQINPFQLEPEHYTSQDCGSSAINIIFTQW